MRNKLKSPYFTFPYQRNMKGSNISLGCEIHTQQVIAFSEDILSIYLHCSKTSVYIDSTMKILSSVFWYYPHKKLSPPEGANIAWRQRILLLTSGYDSTSLWALRQMYKITVERLVWRDIASSLGGRNGGFFIPFHDPRQENTFNHQNNPTF